MTRLFLGLATELKYVVCVLEEFLPNRCQRRSRFLSTSIR